MPIVRLIHWNEAEGLERRRQLEALGFDVRFDFGDGASVMRAMRGTIPDAYVIDHTRMPSHGREVGRVLRVGKATRQIPLVFVDGEREKVAQTRALLPDATFTTWGRIKTALPKALSKPIRDPIVPNQSMSHRPLAAKLGVKPGFTVCLIGSPRGFADTLTPLPKGVTFTARPTAECDLFVCFLRSAREMDAHLLALGRVVAQQVLWLAWPKKASGVASDLDGNQVRRAGLDAGWVDFKVCSVDDTWSGLAFKRRKR